MTPFGAIMQPRARLSPKSARSAAFPIVMFLIVLAVGGCDISGGANWLADEAAGPTPENYRRTIANALGGIVGPHFSQAEIQISEPQRADSTRGATWKVCLRSVQRTQLGESPKASYYGIFIQRERIVESRLAVGIDHCEADSYQPLDWQTEIAVIPIAPKDRKKDPRGAGSR